MKNLSDQYRSSLRFANLIADKGDPDRRFVQIGLTDWID
jgi:hypothetical protein